MKSSLIYLSALLSFCSLAASAANPENVFNRVKNIKAPVLEKRNPRQPFQNERLQKRASPYLNANTESK